MSEFVLASGSPRRLQLLREAGYDFAVHPADVDESDVDPSLLPQQVAETLAERKWQAVARRLPDAVVLAADTVVALGIQTLGKAESAADARRILGLLAGSRHEVITSVVAGRGDGNPKTRRTVCSSVAMRALSDQELDAYIASGQWEGKAGAYGIQDNDPFVTRIEGSLTNIVGLPMDETRAMLDACGIRPG